MTARAVQWGAVVAFAAIVAFGLSAGGDTTGRSVDLAERIACPVCEGESVAASQTDVARAMFERIEQMTAEGWSDAEILGWFEERYGPEILLDPPTDLGGIALWLVPAAVVAVGTAVAIRLRRRRDAGEAAEAGPVSARAIATFAIVAVGLVGAAFALGAFLEPRAAGTPVSGDLTAPTDLESISDETLAATIANYAEAGNVPPTQLNGMRLALAERYFEAGDYRSATSVFQEVLDADPTTTQESEALGRLGWILWVNDEVEAAEAAFSRALEASDGNGEARYLYALMLMELDRQAEAVPLLEALAADPSVPADVLPQIESLLDEARAGT